MENADLRTLAAFSEVLFDEVSGSVVAVDAHNRLYRYLTTTVKWTSSETYTTSEDEEVANLVGIVQGIPKFFEHDLTPAFVLGGGVIEMKDDEVAKRREQREKAEERLEEACEAGDAVETARMEARIQQLVETIQDTSHKLLSLLGVPVVETPAEGEAQASYMARKGDADYVGSKGYDTLLFGAPYMLRQLTSKGNPELMDLDATLDKHDITYKQLVDIAMLCGTDPNKGITGIGPKTVVKVVTGHGDLWSVLGVRGASIPNAGRARESFLDLPVTDDYDYDTDIDPGVAVAREFVTETWEVDPEEVRRGFERIEESVTQTGPDRWTQGALTSGQ